MMTARVLRMGDLVTLLSPNETASRGGGKGLERSSELDLVSVSTQLNVWLLTLGERSEPEMEI